MDHQPHRNLNSIFFWLLKKIVVDTVGNITGLKGVLCLLSNVLSKLNLRAEPNVKRRNAQNNKYFCLRTASASKLVKQIEEAVGGLNCSANATAGAGASAAVGSAANASDSTSGKYLEDFFLIIPLTPLISTFLCYLQP